MTLPPHRYTHAFSQQTRGVQSSTSPFLNWYNKLADSAARYWCISLLQPSQIISIFKMTRSPWRPAVTFYVYQRGGPLVDSSWNLFFSSSESQTNWGSSHSMGEGKLNAMTCQVETQGGHWNGREIPRAILLTPRPTENDLLTSCWFLKHTRGSFLARQRIIHHQSRKKTAGPREVADPSLMLEANSRVWSCAH